MGRKRSAADRIYPGATAWNGGGVMADVKKCQYCKFSLWRPRRSTGKSDFSKPGLCVAITDKRLIVSAASSCGKWEKV